MSTTSVLIEELGPRGKRRVRIATVVALIFAALAVYWMYLTLSENNQLEAARWTGLFAGATPKFLAEGLRCEIDPRSEKIGYKIREAELKKIPFMCIIGQKEAEQNTLTLRRHTKGDLGSMTFEEALAAIKDDHEQN